MRSAPTPLVAPVCHTEWCINGNHSEGSRQLGEHRVGVRVEQDRGREPEGGRGRVVERHRLHAAHAPNLLLLPRKIERDGYFVFIESRPFWKRPA